MIHRLARDTFAMFAVLGIAAFLAGCGGGGENSSSAGAAAGHDAPQPRQAIAEQLPALERAISTLDCSVALQVIHPVVLPEPEAADSRKNCAAAISTLRRIQGFAATDSREFGTAALVDGQVNGRNQSLLWALDEQGDFKWIGLAVTAAQLDKVPAEGIDRKPPVDAFLQALRDEDCHAAFAQLATGSPLSLGDEKTFCANFTKNFAADAEGFGSRLQADPEAQAAEMGATQNLGFYGVATNPAGYRTVIVGAPSKAQPPKIFDVVPGAR